MRLWSIHPRYLDRQGLLAVWREGLLAKKVLAGRTKGYKNHPQLERFKNSPRPQAAINTYLWHIFQEAAIGYAKRTSQVRLWVGPMLVRYRFVSRQSAIMLSE